MFRFTIRDVLWLTAVAAIALGWWLDHRRLSMLADQMRSFESLSIALTEELKSKNPAARLRIEIDGQWWRSEKVELSDPTVIVP